MVKRCKWPRVSAPVLVNRLAGECAERLRIPPEALRPQLFILNALYDLRGKSILLFVRERLGPADRLFQKPGHIENVSVRLV